MIALLLSTLGLGALAAQPLNVSGGIVLRWDQLPNPSLRHGEFDPGTVGYDPEGRRLFLLGVHLGASNGEELVIQIYDQNTETWTEEGVGPLSLVNNAGCWWTALFGARRALFVVSRRNYVTVNLVTLKTRVGPTPYQGYCGAACVVAEDVESVFCFGGRNLEEERPAETNALRRIHAVGDEPSDWTWEEVVPTGPVPLPRSGHIASYSNGVIYTYGGEGFFDLWSYDVHANKWQLVYEVKPNYVPVLGVMEFATEGVLLIVSGYFESYDVQALLMSNGNVLRTILTSEFTETPIFNAPPEGDHEIFVAPAETELFVYADHTVWYLSVMMPHVVGTCTPDSIDESQHVTCVEEQCTNERCLGLAAGVQMHAYAGECNRSPEFERICRDWENLKRGMRSIFQVTLIDITADVVNLVVVAIMFIGLLLGQLKYWPGFAQSFISLSGVCFMVDLVCQGYVISSARALRAIDFVSSNCFSIGAGNEVMVKLEDLLGDTATFGFIMLGIAVLGGIADCTDGCCGSEGSGISRQALLNIITLASLELALGLVDLVANQFELVDGLENIERGIMNLGYMEQNRSFTCTMLTPQIAPFELDPVRPREDTWWVYIGGTILGLSAWVFLWRALVWYLYKHETRDPNRTSARARLWQSQVQRLVSRKLEPVGAMTLPADTEMSVLGSSRATDPEAEHISAELCSMAQRLDGEPQSARSVALQLRRLVGEMGGRKAMGSEVTSKLSVKQPLAQTWKSSGDLFMAPSV